MKIVIAGAGKVGSEIIRLLNNEGHDICVIDSDSETISFLTDEIDVKCYQGDATSYEVLQEAGASEADLFVAATQQDETNMICGISARRLGTKHVIARIRDPKYLHETEFLRDAFGLDVIVNPELECAREISRIIRYPAAARVDAFTKGRIEIAEHRVRAGGRLEGLKLKNLQKEFGAKVLVCLVERGKEAIAPNGEFELRTDDILSITGTSNELLKFFKNAGAYKKALKNVMIIGGGRTGVYLSELLAENALNVTIIDRSRERCELLCQVLPDASIIYGDATKSNVLYEEGIKKADAFVALTGDDGNNIVTSLFASSIGKEKIVTKVNHEPFTGILSSSGLDCVVSPKQIVAQQIARYVRAMSDSKGSSMEALYRLAEGKAEAIEFHVEEGARCINTPLKELKLRKGVLFASVTRGKTGIIPDGNTSLLPGDYAVVVAPAGMLFKIDDIVEGR